MNLKAPKIQTHFNTVPFHFIKYKKIAGVQYHSYVAAIGYLLVNAPTES